MHLLISFFFAIIVKIQGAAAYLLDKDWCYQSQVTCGGHCTGPDGWTTVAGACGGKAQSPINIVTRRTLPDGRLTPFTFAGYQEAFHSLITNNGRTVHVDLPATAKVQGGDLAVPYKAIQLHLHLGKDGGPGSEHTIDGERYPMELHIVNIKEEYNSLDEALKDLTGVGVLGFFYEQSGSSNKKYDSIINALNSINMPSSNTTLSDVSLDMFIPSQSNMTSYFRYQGSLTTPPCEEAVVWTVFKNTIPLSRQQLDAFSRLQFADGKPMVGTYRPVQPLNGRLVYRSGSQVILVSTWLLITSVISAIGLPLPK
ncbi:carbonic anhydrase 4 isoform X1 [Oncorhynchus kisutch]|uniref:Carbonic anhydrase n=1 Tax=Oncorhynchus kisutch TaxID=8019 RepID=A0A8C7HWI0_ONCKI|nr:carbonic anhydrase 4 isoform X1 [Oncorhynchus kisutch]